MPALTITLLPLSSFFSLLFFFFDRSTDMDMFVPGRAPASENGPHTKELSTRLRHAPVIVPTDTEIPEVLKQRRSPANSNTSGSPRERPAKKQKLAEHESDDGEPGTVPPHSGDTG